MFDIGGGELILIVLAVIVLFGPKKIPEVAQMIRKGMTNFYKAQQEIKEQISNIETEIKATVNDIDKASQQPAKTVQTPENTLPSRKYKDIQTNLDVNEINPEKNDFNSKTTDLK